MRGGRRAGAGRPKGSRNRHTRESLEEVKLAIADGPAPMALMLSTMRSLWAKATAKEGELDLRYAERACELAKHAAPYLHPKLTNVEMSGQPQITVKKVTFVLDKQGKVVGERQAPNTTSQSASDSCSPLPAPALPVK